MFFFQYLIELNVLTLNFYYLFAIHKNKKTLFVLQCETRKRFLLHVYLTM